MFILMNVRMKGLEPPRPEAQDPKSCSATNYDTSATISCILMQDCKDTLFLFLFMPAADLTAVYNAGREYNNHSKYDPEKVPIPELTFCRSTDNNTNTSTNRIPKFTPARIFTMNQVKRHDNRLSMLM
jgi:hypothetical protein